MLRILMLLFMLAFVLLAIAKLMKPKGKYGILIQYVLFLSGAVSTGVLVGFIVFGFIL